MPMGTEDLNPRTVDMDLLPTEDLLRLINQEDARVPQAVAEAIPSLSKLVEVTAEALRRGGRLIYVGAGTSGRIGVLDAAEWGPTFGMEGAVVAVMAGGYQALVKPVEGAEDDEEAAVRDMRSVSVSSKDVVLGLSASGRTPYVISAVRYSKGVGAFTACVTSNRDSPLSTSVDLAVVVDVGPEVVAGSTRMKAGTAEKLVLNSLSTAVMVKLGKVYRNYMVELRPLNSKTRGRAVRIVSQICGVDQERALKALSQVDFDVKAAIVSLKLGVSGEEARELLSKSGRDLRGVLGERGK